MIVWYWSPNAISENLEFATEVLRTRTAERRVSYTDAVQRLTYRYIVRPDVSEQMNQAYLADPNQTFLVPEWPTATFDFSANIASGETVISIADNVVYAVGQQVIIGIGDNWEQAEVATLGGTSITLVGGLASAYAATSAMPVYIAPLIECICPGGLQYGVEFGVRRPAVEFLSIAPIDIPQNPYSLFDGLPFVNDGDALFGGLSGSVGRASILADSGFGAFEIVESETFTRRSGTLGFSDLDDSDRISRRRFFHFMRGRDGEMQVASKQDEIKLNSGFSASTLAIDVQPIAAAANMVGRVIRISQGSNAVLREITSATDNSATSQTLGFSAVGFVGTTDARIEIVTRCRFDDDLFPIEYLFTVSGLLARCTMPTIEVP